MDFFSNTFEDNITQVAAVIDDTLLKPLQGSCPWLWGSSREEWRRLLVVLPPLIVQ